MLRLMQILLIFALLLAAFSILFALQNSELITLDLIFIQIQSSLALVLLITLALGVVIGSLVSGYNLFSKNRQIAKQTQQIKELEQTIEKTNSTETKATPTAINNSE